MTTSATGSLIARKTFNEKMGKQYSQYLISLPSSLANDSLFPFNLKKQPLEITIDGDRLIIEVVEVDE